MESIVDSTGNLVHHNYHDTLKSKETPTSTSMMTSMEQLEMVRRQFQTATSGAETITFVQCKMQEEIKGWLDSKALSFSKLREVWKSYATENDQQLDFQVPSFVQESSLG